jgi:hypothetical protein
MYVDTDMNSDVRKDKLRTDEMKSRIMNAKEEVRRLGDKRKLKRFSDRLNISFNVNGIVYSGLLTNFSLNGLFIKTNYSFPPNTRLDMTIYLPNDLISHVKGKVVRTSIETILGVSGKTRGCAEKGIGIELTEEDVLYLHFIRSFVSSEGRHIFRQLAFAEQDEKYQQIEAELQEKCRLFDVVAVVIGEESEETGFKGKAWFEAKIKNNTDHVFIHPIVTFITTKDDEYMQEGKGNRPPDTAVMLMSSSDDSLDWKPGETIILDGEIDPLSGDVPLYELNFFDYLTKAPEFAVDLPMRINDYVSTLWIGSPCLDEINENIPDNIPFELLKPSSLAEDIGSEMDDSVKSDDTEPEDVFLLPSSECAGEYDFLGDNLQHDETDEAVDNIEISYPPSTGLEYEPESPSEDENKSDGFDGGRPIIQENTDKSFKKDKSISPVSKWAIVLGSIIVISLFISGFFIYDEHQPSFIKQSALVSPQKKIARVTEREEAVGKQQQDGQKSYSTATKTSQEQRKSIVLVQTKAIRLASVNKRVQDNRSNKRRRQSLSATGRYSMQIGVTVYKKGKGTVTDIWGGSLIDCGSICSTLGTGALYLTATPDVGFVFVKWLGCDKVDVNRACMVNMASKDRSVTAVFEGGGQKGNTERSETAQAGTG